MNALNMSNAHVESQNYVSLTAYVDSLREFRDSNSIELFEYDSVKVDEGR